MTYTKQEWIDQETVISAARMGHIEDGVEAAHVLAEDLTTPLDTRLTAVEGQGDNLDTRLTAAEGDITALEDLITPLDTRLTAVEGAVDVLEPGSWSDRPLTSPWTPYDPNGTSYYPGMRARRVSSGVQVQGMVKGGEGNTEICTLPSGLTPSYGAHYPAISNGAAACVFVSGSGQVRYISGGSSAAYVSINLIIPIS